MDQFRKIFVFEFKGYLTNKVFVGVTLALVIVLAAVLFFPRILAFIDSDEPEPEGPAEDAPVMLLEGGGEDMAAALQAAFPGYRVKISEGDIREAVRSGEAECGISITGPLDFVYLVEDLTMYDMNAETVSQVLTGIYRMQALGEAGVPADRVEEILSASADWSVESLGVDQMQNFFYTYVMIFALYMVILLYGQMVATNVATEKSSRAMELLVTSADPVAMMFGKVLASCLAGLLQLVCIFGSAILFYNLNSSYMEMGGIMSMIFDMPPALLGYMLVYFILGFLLYAFMFGAVGSTASKLEDINTSVMPVTLLFIAGFLVVVFSMTSGNMDNMLMRICSYVPFTSPMAMFTRIAMSSPAGWEIVVSVVILIASCAGVGVLAAKIYRVGVLLYGSQPKIGELIKTVWKA